MCVNSGSWQTFSFCKILIFLNFVVRVENIENFISLILTAINTNFIYSVIGK